MKSELRDNCISSLSIVVSAYNDSQTITKVLDSAREVLENYVKDYEIVVLNDSSRDNTLEILQAYSKEYPYVKVRTHRKNLGHGMTRKELLTSATKELIFSLPGNGQIDPREVLKLLPHIREYNLVLGWRKERRINLRRKLQTKIYNLLINLLYRVGLSDVNTVRLLRREDLRKIKLSAQSAFVDAELCYKYKQRGLKIIEVPITHKGGKSRGGGSLKTILPAFWEALLLRFKV